MKLSIETKALQEALRIVGVASESGISLPILQGVKIETLNKNGAILSATNLDLFCTKIVPAKVSKEGGIIINHDLLSRFASQMDGMQVTIDSSEKLATISSSHAEATIEVFPPEDFPPDLVQDKKASREISAASVILPFSKVEHSISPDKARYTLCGVNLRPNGSGTDFAATTGTRLSVFHSEEVTKEDVIVSDTYVRALLKIPMEGTVEFNISHGNISISCDGVKLSGKLLEGKFPSWSQVVPEKPDKVFTCGRKELISAIQTCSIFTNREMPGLILTGKQKEIEVAKLGKAKVKVMGSELAGQPDFQIGVNSRHMLSTLNVLEGDEVRIQCVDNQTAFMIEEGKLLEVLVPVTTTQ